MTLDLLAPPTKTNTWRLNSSLLTDPVLLPQTATSPKNYFELNTTPGMDPMTIWEANKCTLRADLIKMGAWRKKEREQEIKHMIERIHSLETKHKQSLSEQSAISF